MKEKEPNWDHKENINKRTQETWNKIYQHPEISEPEIQKLCQDIFDNTNIKIKLQKKENIKPQKNYIIAANHPTVLDEHKILFENTHSLPYYIPFLDMIMQKETGKKVHFILTDPIDEGYRKIVHHLEHIMIPESKNGKKMTKEEKEKLNKEIQKYLEKGDHVALFPEGNWFGTDNIGPLKKGLIHILKQNPDYDLLPIRLDGFDRPYKNIDVTFGSPYKFKENQQTPEEIAENIRKKIFQKELGLNPVETR